MKKHDIQTVSVLLSLCLLFSVLLSGCNGCSIFSTEYMTRGEWIDLLGRNFALSGEDDDPVYFTDVPAGSEIFDFVQGAVNWGIIENTGMFAPDEPADRKFVATTAARASGLTNSGDILTAAMDAGLLRSTDASYLQEKVTHEEGQYAVEWALDIYFGSNTEAYDNSVLADGIYDYSGLSENAISVDDNGTVSVSSSISEKLAKGDIIITPPTIEDPAGTARKIISVSETNGEYIYITSDPELSDLYDKLDISTYTLSSGEYFVPAEGVEVIEYNPGDNMSLRSDIHAAPLAPVSGDQQVYYTSGASFKLSIDISSGDIKLNGEYSEPFSQTTASGILDEGSEEYSNALGSSTTNTSGHMVEFPDGKEYSIPVTEKYTDGFSVKGSIALSNIYVDEIVVNGLIFINEFSANVHCDIDTNITIQGKFDDKLTIGQVYIPTPVSGMYARFNLSISAAINTDASLSASFETVTKVNYVKGNGVKATCDKEYDYDAKLSISGNVSVSGLLFLEAFGVDLIDVKLSFGMGFEASLSRRILLENDSTGDLYNAAFSSAETAYSQSVGYSYFRLVCCDLKVYAPIISVSVGTEPSSLLNRFNVTKTINIMDKSNALFTSPYLNFHCENSKGWVDTCTAELINKFEPVESAPTTTTTSASWNNSDSWNGLSGNGTPPEMICLEFYYTGSTMDMDMCYFPKNDELLPESSVDITGVINNIPNEVEAYMEYIHWECEYDSNDTYIIYNGNSHFSVDNCPKSSYPRDGSCAVAYEDGSTMLFGLWYYSDNYSPTNDDHVRIYKLYMVDMDTGESVFIDSFQGDAIGMVHTFSICMVDGCMYYLSDNSMLRGISTDSSNFGDTVYSLDLEELALRYDDTYGTKAARVFFNGIEP